MEEEILKFKLAMLTIFREMDRETLIPQHYYKIFFLST